MLDLAAYEARRWQTWQVFAIAFAVYLGGILLVVHQCCLSALGTTDLWVSALMASIAVAGLGYQETHRMGAYGRWWPWFGEGDQD